MALLEKLQTLGNAASWDSCGGVKQKSMKKAGIPASYSSFIYDCANSSEPCRLMKVLQSNSCIHDCRYCVNNKCGSKAELAPIELAKSFNSLERAGHVEGLFLSSAVTGEADRTAEKMIESARLLRQRFRFHGYIHLKALPTMSKHLIFEMASLANRLSLNLEAVDKEHWQELGSTKDYRRDLQQRLLWLDEAKRRGKLTSFTTQLILGAAGENDLDVLEKMRWMYENTKLHRTYFSAFQPIKGTALEKQQAEKALREYQLYQSDWLLRIYGFKLKEIKLGLNEQNKFGNARDIKMAIAANNPNQFPVDVNCATKEELLRVPGIGPVGAERVLKIRQQGKFRELKQLRKAGVITRRAQGFIQLDGLRQSKLGYFC
ncbi:MAG: helix-hairpin-helix domain-containing protein [Candidatus Diapherotrites archaeon]|uniref:Helix-hairpin-helix domain-containing protein n=1 Tax=Candidatus Iainarchaeum sp. TaxID=3101447 RepID=A0A938YMN9_9ARCH|nr:helix-hairpin-helix domain-containing protein [Candidatus Diapherotrites archaeon]